MVTAEEQPPFISRDEFERRFDETNHRFDALDALAESFNRGFDEVNRRITVLMWVIVLSNAGIFAVLGWIISRLD